MVKQQHRGPDQAQPDTVYVYTDSNKIRMGIWIQSIFYIFIPKFPSRGGGNSSSLKILFIENPKGVLRQSLSIC